MNQNLYQAFRDSITDPDRTFAEDRDGNLYSYRDLELRSAQFAQALVNQGVTPGDRVAVQVEKSIETVFLYLGCLRAGAVYLPLNTAYTLSEVDYFLKDAEPRIAICSPESEPGFRELASNCGVASVETMTADGRGSIADQADKANGLFDIIERKPDDLAAILYTSGTTGRSKGAMLTHDNLLSNAKTLQTAWAFTADDVLLHGLPIFHTHGLFVAINITLLAGSSMIFLPAFNVNDMIERLPASTVMMGVPTFYTRLLDSPDFSRAQCRSIRLFISGSAPLSAETHKRFEQHTGHAILERYGMTETNMNTSNPYAGERRAGTVGMPLEQVELQITDPGTGKPLPQGDVGMIEVRGPNVFKGYWRMPDKTREELRDNGFFITGDLGRFDEQGYLHIVGRSKDLIISGGYNVYPAEVEAALDACDGVTESAVIGLPHHDYGEAVTAIVVASGDKNGFEQRIIATLSADLARYKIPKRVICIEHLPRNTMGKIQKKALRETYSDLYQ